MERKIQKEYVDEGLGFPVYLINVPMIKIRNEWTPDIDYNRFEIVVLLALANKEGRLTGNEIGFIRQHFKMTLEKFGTRFTVSHPAVKKWEAKGNHPTEMMWATEKDIRLFILDQLHQKATAILKAYKKLEIEAPILSSPIKIEAHKLSA
jgi:hypothetical protein